MDRDLPRLNFNLEPPAAAGLRYKLVVSIAAAEADKSVTPVSGLTFYVAALDNKRVLGKLSHRDVFVTADAPYIVELAPADTSENALGLTISEISWSSYGTVHTANSVELRAARATPLATYTPSETDLGRGPRAMARPGSSAGLAEWINWACANEPVIGFGSEPQVMLSFAQADQSSARTMEKHLEAAMLRRTDPRTGRAGSVWSYRDGIRPGAHIDEKVVRAMSEARAAIVFLSKDYFASAYCHAFELPFLLWRHVAHDLPLRVVRVGPHTSHAPYTVPGRDGSPRVVDIYAMADDRMATPLGSPLRNRSIIELTDHPGEIDRRFSLMADELTALVLN